MKSAGVVIKRNIRTITLLFDLISPIMLYQFMVKEKILLKSILFAVVVLIRIIFVVIS